MKQNLVVTVNYRSQTGKVKVVTDATVRLEGKPALAFGTLGGRWTPEQVRKEFEKHPERFQPQPGNTAETVAFVAKHGAAPSVNAA